jgi:hypothetical protein
VTGDYLWDRSGPRDPEIVRLERVLGTLKQQNPPARLRLPASSVTRTPPMSFLIMVAAAAAVVVTLVGFAWIHRFDAGPGFQVTRVSGAPVIATQPVADQTELKVGTWLETRTDGRATVQIANIGQVQVEPDTRLGLLSTRPGNYRLHLERGTMHAFIWSPPGQFFVETPSSTAVDLGCAYTMTVDAEGNGTVRVTSGWVGFEWRGRESFIPAGATCSTRPGLGPGTPHYDDTSDGFRDALFMIDVQGASVEGRTAALTRILGEARERDTLTLWHLLTRVDENQRDRVFDKLAQFVPPPAGVTREGIRAGNRLMLDDWWDRLGLGTTNWWRVWKQPWREGK